MKAIKTLEFDKIRQMLSEAAAIPAAAERLASLLPQTDIAVVRHALAETAEARAISVKQGRAPIPPIADVRGSVKRSVIGASLSCGELLSIASVLRVARNVASYTDVRDFAATYPILQTVCAALHPNRDLEQRISDAIISEDELDDNASPALSAIRRKKATTANKIKDILEEIVRSAHYKTALQEQIITQRGGRYVVPVKAEHRAELPGVVHDTSQTGSTLFVEPMKVVDANNEIRRLTAEEKEEIDRILAAFSAEVADNADDIGDCYATLVDLDCIFAKGRFADQLDASCPIVNDKGIIDIKRGRHPLLERRRAVPIDIRIGEDFDTLVITGPNTGGKTVSLKTVGLLTMMTAAGLHIPAADGSKVAVFTQIFADIGDEQSIEQSLSTFSAHMVNIVDITAHADAQSLVLFDELGAGTDPTEGAALATAILKDMRMLGAKTVATTHYSEIKLFALSTEGVENAACEFDVATLRPTYRLLIGALGKSNAFAIASRLGMPDSIISAAREMLSAENTRFEDVVSLLEQNRRTAEEEREAAQRLRREAEELREKLAHDNDITEEKRKKVLDEARQEAKRLLRDAKEDITRRIKEAQSADNRSKALEQAKRDIGAKLTAVSADMAETVVKSTKKMIKPSDIRPGTPLLIDAMGQVGTALRAPDKDGNLEIQLGLLKIKTHISTVSPAPEEKKSHAHTILQRRNVPMGVAPCKTEVDVRGQNLDEATLVVEKYLDDAVLAHLEQVTIIHGKGTGVLRAGIHQLLRANKTVKSYRLGKYGEGEDGVTIVELR